MKQIKLLGVLALALSLGLAACGGTTDGGEGDASSGSSKHVHTFDTSVWESNDTQHWHPATCEHKTQKGDAKAHTFGEPYEVNKATCEQDGSQKVKCTVCQKEVTQTLTATGHSDAPAADSDLWTAGKAPTCTQEGDHSYVCENCHQPVTVKIAALDHSWKKATDQSGAKDPTCTATGIEIEECERCGEKRNVTLDALDHDFSNPHELEVPATTEKNVFGNDTIWAHITNYSCSRGDSFRYAWSAKEVNFDYKNVPEGKEPELLDEGEDGIRFWGRPIGNAMALDSEGTASGNDAEKIPDPTVKGSRFEFDFVFDEDLTDVCLSAELTPAQYTNDIFKNRQGDQEWTPGYRFIPKVDENNQPVIDPETGEQELEPEMIEQLRYIIYLDGEEVELDASVNTSPNGRRWYQFPCKLNLSKGKHNLNIAMAGGYRHTFYQFSFEKVVAEEEPADPNAPDYTKVLSRTWDANPTAKTNSAQKEFFWLNDSTNNKVGAKIHMKNYTVEATGAHADTVLGDDGKIAPGNEHTAILTYKITAPKAGAYQMIMRAKSSTSNNALEKSLADRYFTVKLNGVAVDIQDSRVPLTADTADFVAAPTINLTGNEDVIEITAPDYRPVFDISADTGFIIFAEH